MATKFNTIWNERNTVELRHLRYFVAVADQRSFVAAAKALRVAQPALSKQIGNLEAELGVKLLNRIPRGVTLTPAGEAFLAEARLTLASADRAASSARQANRATVSTLQFGTGTEMGVYASDIADLLGGFRRAYPDVGLRVHSYDQTEQHAALREGRVDVAATFLMSWPPAEFRAHRLRDCSLTGVLIAATHPLAARRSLRLSELSGLTYIHRSGVHWKENFRLHQLALRDRGLLPSQYRERAVSPSDSVVQIAAADSWSLSNKAIAAQFVDTTTTVVFRPFEEPPIKAWLSFIWTEHSNHLVEGLIGVARSMNMAIAPDEGRNGLHHAAVSPVH